MNNAEELYIYDQSIKLVKDILLCTSRLREEGRAGEKFNFSAQARKLSISVSSNIASGFYMDKTSEKYSDILKTTYIKTTKVYCLIHIANNLKIIEKSEFENLSTNITDIMQKIYKFRESLMQPNFVNSKK